MVPLRPRMGPFRPGMGTFRHDMVHSGLGWALSILGWALLDIGWALSGLRRAPQALDDLFRPVMVPSQQGLRHRGGRGGRVPPIFESAGDNPPHFQENRGPNPLSFRFLVWATL